MFKEAGILTLREVAEGLEVNMTALDELVTEVQDAGNRAAKTEAAYKIENAKSRLTIKGTAIEKLTVSDIEAEALIQCEGLFTAYLIAQNHLLTVREALRAVQSKVDGYRTLAASFRNAGG